MSVPQMSGQTLVNMTNDLLAGYQNAVDSRAMLTYLNMAKDEIWSTIKELHEEYFQVFSQSTDSTADYYFPQLSTATRNYTLPDDLRSIEYIEVTTPSFEESDFVYAKLNSPEFKEERRASNAQNGPNATNNGSKFHYTIAGKNQFVLASYPPADLNLTLWYTRALPDFETGDPVDEILFPFQKKLAEYAAKKVMLSNQDATQFAAWSKEWRDSLVNCLQAAGERNDADPQFVEDFCGDD